MNTINRGQRGQIIFDYLEKSPLAQFHRAGQLERREAKK